MIRLLIVALMLLAVSWASWAGTRGSSRTPGLSSNQSTTRHGFPSGTGP